MLPERLRKQFDSVGARITDNPDGTSHVHVPGARYEALIDPSGTVMSRPVHIKYVENPWTRNERLENFVSDIVSPGAGRSIGQRIQSAHELLEHLVGGNYLTPGGLGYETSVHQNYADHGPNRVTHTVRVRLAGHTGNEAIVHSNHPSTDPNQIQPRGTHPFDPESLAMAKYAIENRDDTALKGLTDYLVDKHNASHLMTKMSRVSRRTLRRR